MLQNCKGKTHTYALHTLADFSAQIMENQFKGMLLKIDQKEVWTQNLLVSLMLITSWQFFGRPTLGKRPMGDFEIDQSVAKCERKGFKLLSTGKVMIVIDCAHTPMR